MALSQVTDVSLPAFYTATNGQTAVTVPFEFRSNDDVAIYVDGTKTTITTDYTLTGADTDGGGTATFLSAFSGGENITVMRERDYARSNALSEGPIKKSTIDNEWHSELMLIQQINAKADRSLHQDTTDTGTLGTLGSSTDRANRFLSFDANGTAEFSQTVGDWQGDWVTGTDYAKNDIIRDDSTGNIYIAKDDYTSGASVSADVSAGDLELVIDYEAANTAATNAANSASAAATSETNAATSETNAAASASAAAASETAAAASETNAAASETAAASSETNAATSESQAEEWANQDEDVEITFSAGNFSAKLYAAKAASSAGAIDGKTIKDDDNDTRIETERSADEDRIYVRAGGVDVLEANSSGVTVTNLTVLGEANTINSTNTTISDNVITINEGQSSGTLDGGLIVDRGSDTNVAFIWDESADRFSLQYTVSDGSSISPLDDSGPAGLEVGALETQGVTTANADILPGTDITHDLGSSSAKWSTVYATTFDGTASAAKYADVAEIYTPDCELGPGDVVAIGGEREVTLAEGRHTTRIFGVVSTNPGYLLNSGADGVPIALSGRVRVKVVGTVRQGDRLALSATPGIAEAVDEEAAAAMSALAIIGRSLENKPFDGIGNVEAVVSIK